jgi:hypothetical protein
MTRKELYALKARIAERTDKANDLDIIVNQVMVLPCGQLKKVLTDEVMTVLAKYGYTEQRS